MKIVCTCNCKRSKHYIARLTNKMFVLRAKEHLFTEVAHPHTHTYTHTPTYKPMY